MADAPHAGDSSPGRGAGPIAWIMAMLAPLAVLLIVRPWTPGAFPVWDFADMLPLLRGADSVADAWRALADFSRIDGRANDLTYLQIALTWAVAGDDPVLWQWQRAILMIAMALLLVITIRACGGTPLGAAAASLMVILSVSGAEGWVLLMGEPLVVILLCVVVLLGQTAQTGRGGMWTGVGLALGTAGVILTKEVAILLLPPALLLGLVWNPQGRFSSRLTTIQLRQHAMPVVISCLLASLPFLIATGTAGGSGYTSGYRVTVEGLARFPSLTLAMLLPVWYEASDWRTVLYPANLAWVVAVTFGIVAFVRADLSKHHAIRLPAILLYFPIAGALVYSFWPRYSAFYGVPFMIGGAGLLAVALTMIQRRSVAGLVAGCALTLATASYSALTTYWIVNERRAFADLARSAAQVLATDTTTDSLLVIKPAQGANRWPISASELARYAVAIGVPAHAVPHLVEVTCEVAAARLREPAGRTGFLNDQNSCGPLPTSTYRLVAVAQRVDWIDWTASDDSLVVQLLFPILPTVAPGTELTPPDTAAGSATTPAGP